MIPDKMQIKLMHWLLPLVCSITLFATAPYIMAEEITSRQASPPPPVTLQYIVRVKITAMSIGGSSTIKWQHTGNEYAIQTSARGNLLGTVLETSSKGNINAQGLKPKVFTEKRLNRNKTTTTFDHQNHLLTFSESQQSLPFSEGIQDQASIVWQLASIARARPEKFTAGNTLTFRVSGRNRIDQWDFRIEEERTLQTPLGEIKTVYLIRQDKKGKTTEAWLAPDKNWYPVKLIFSDNRDFRLEQTIQKITPE